MPSEHSFHHLADVESALVVEQCDYLVHRAFFVWTEPRAGYPAIVRYRDRNGAPQTFMTGARFP